MEQQQLVIANQQCLFLQQSQPVLQGSGFIIPRAHRETVFDMTSQEWAATQDLLQQVKQLLDEQWQPAGYNVGWNNGQVAGQTVMHVHMHVIPRFADEPYAGRGMRSWLKSEANLRPGTGRNRGQVSSP